MSRQEVDPVLMPWAHVQLRRGVRVGYVQAPPPDDEHRGQHGRGCPECRIAVDAFNHAERPT